VSAQPPLRTIISAYRLRTRCATRLMRTLFVYVFALKHYVELAFGSETFLPSETVEKNKKSAGFSPLAVLESSCELPRIWRRASTAGASHVFMGVSTTSPPRAIVLAGCHLPRAGTRLGYCVGRILPPTVANKNGVWRNCIGVCCSLSQF
jgi:hypothetical protein